MNVSKAFLREKLKRDRKELAPRHRAEMEDVMVARLNDLLIGLEGETVALYWPMNGEADITSLVAMPALQGRTLCLPRVIGSEKPLMFNMWVSDQIMDVDLFNIPCAMGAEVTPDIIILPVLGFDQNGYRLGYGGGFYDRTLHALPDALAIGVGFQLQQLTQIPHEAHDKPLQWVVTEAESIYCQHDN